MVEFYGEGCILTKSIAPVHWFHTLNGASESGSERLSQMLHRNLREDRYPSHAAEVRENLVPVDLHHHDFMDPRFPMSTLFLHEDTVARTLAYELDLQAWRIAELDAGRPDPGRPTYDEVFGGERVTQHRYHCSGSSGTFLRQEGNVYTQYHSRDCPGIDDPTSQNHFPIIDTLLSIPFSLLHNFPRLSALLPPHTYQQQLVAMSAHITHLWWWDPSREMIA